jgi:hypothetical protein
MCDFCKKNNIEKVFATDEIDGTVEMFTCWDYEILQIGATDGGVSAYYQPKYCPECGRKLLL